MNKTTSEAPRGLNHLNSLGARYRNLLAALTAACSLNAVACGGNGNGTENPGGSGGMAGSAGEGETVACINDSQCDDNNPCNGVETCGSNNNCVSGTPINYDDGLVCNGTESCDPATGNKINGVSIDCNNHGTCQEPSGNCDCQTGYAEPDCGSCDTGYTGYPTCEVIPPAPVISGLGIDCSSTSEYCFAGETYPVSFDFQNATSYTTSLQLVSGSTTLGTIDQPSGTLTGSSKTLNYTLGNTGAATVRLTVIANGPGGEQSQSIDIDYW